MDSHSFNSVVANSDRSLCSMFWCVRIQSGPWVYDWRHCFNEHHNFGSILLCIPDCLFTEKIKSLHQNKNEWKTFFMMELQA